MARTGRPAELTSIGSPRTSIRCALAVKISVLKSPKIIPSPSECLGRIRLAIPPPVMKYSLLALGLLGFLLADSALAAQLPAGRLSTAPDPRHGNYDNDDGVSFALVWPSNKASASGHDVAPIDLHDGAHDHMHGAGSSSPFDPSSLYGPNGEVLEPIPGINAPPIHSHRQSVYLLLLSMRSHALHRADTLNPGVAAQCNLFKH